MVFSSLPLYHLDSQNWHQQQSNDHQLLHPTHHHHDPSSQLPLPPPPQNQGPGGDGGSTGLIKPNSMVDRARQAQLPLPEPGLKCPRCESTNTKFCYFNNYNLSQPRHFCKTCRRYWTRGGSLRNVPVGGGSRRTAKRSKGRSNTGSSSLSGSKSPATISASSGAGNPCSTSLFLSHDLQTPTLPHSPFLPSLHHLGHPNPIGIGLNLLGSRGSSEMEFPNLMASFEGLGRINGMHPFENSNNIGNVELFSGRIIGHSLQSKPSDMDSEVINRVTPVKTEDTGGMNFAKDFVVVQGNDQQFNWNNNVWTNSDLSSFTSPSSAGHLLG